MEILYLCPDNDLADLFFRGWKNAFEALGHSVTRRVATTPGLGRWLSNHPVDLIFTHSGEGVQALEPKQLNQKKIKLIVGALPANSFRASFDPHTPLAPEGELEIMAQVDQCVVWSQHEPFLFPFFYQAYLEREIPLVYLPYAADLTQLQPLQFQEKPPLDFLFIGKLSHRKRGNLALLDQLLPQLETGRVQIYGDELWSQRYPAYVQKTDGGFSHEVGFCRTAISPNLHSHRQKKRMIQVNNRTFDIPLYGGFQLTDHPLSAKFFGPEEICIGSTKELFMEQFFFYLTRPELRKQQIEAARERLCLDHSYFNRLATLFEVLGVNEPIYYQQKLIRPTLFECDPDQFNPPGHPFTWAIEHRSFEFLRRVRGLSGR